MFTRIATPPTWIFLAQTWYVAPLGPSNKHYTIVDPFTILI